MQEFIRPNPEGMAHWSNAAEFVYATEISPDFYGWVFPHRDYVSIGVGTKYEHAKEISQYLKNLKKLNAKWIDGGEVLGRGAAPIPYTVFHEPARGRIFLVGDAAGFVLPGCGEGIYYAMKSGEYAAEAIIGTHVHNHTNPALSYNLKCEREFKRNFTYFSRIEKVVFQNNFTREIFVRYCREPHAADNVMNVFSAREKMRHSGIAGKISKVLALNRIRAEIKKEGLNFKD
jgi:geranylgeranyl reductase